MSQLWALTRNDGRCSLIYTDGPAQHPTDCGNRAACQYCNVWPLAREPMPALGEVVDHATGAITFNLSAALPALLIAIKAEAARRIEAIAPLWRQTNDIRQPSADGTARFAAIDAVRVWSNQLEANAAAATLPAHITTIRSQLENH